MNARGGPGSTRPEGQGAPGLGWHIGPFSLRQLGLAALVATCVGVVLFLGTRPLVPGGTGAPTLGPLPTQFAVGSPGQGIAVGQRAPELLVRAAAGRNEPITDLDGRPVTLESLRGGPVWLNFWASWCPPCQAETPVLREIAERYGPSGLTVVGISVQEATADDVRTYAQRYGLGYTIAADLTGDVFRAYRLFGLPTQFLLDRDGVVRVVIQGPVTVASAEDALRSLGLAPPPAPSPTLTPAPTP